jgi:hypothetical protein
MLKNLFKKPSINQVVKGKTTNQIIEEIHESFYTEVDKLLSSAKIANSLDTDKQDLIDKCNRLKALGFTSTQEVKEAELEIERLTLLKNENDVKKNLIEAINYFSFKYPNYKFITEESVKKICKKYNLVYGAINRYIGTVPDKNLKHIEDFKVLEDDECYVEERSNSWTGIEGGIEEGVSRKYQTKDQFDLTQKEKSELMFRYHMSTIMAGFREINMKCPLEIAAPLKDFNMSSAEVKDFKISNIEIPDPVVLKPVIFNGQKHYLIVTAWGIEAGDELVVNPIHN